MSQCICSRTFMARAAVCGRAGAALHQRVGPTQARHPTRRATGSGNAGSASGAGRAGSSRVRVGSAAALGSRVVQLPVRAAQRLRAAAA